MPNLLSCRSKLSLVEFKKLSLIQQYKVEVGKLGPVNSLLISVKKSFVEQSHSFTYILLMTAFVLPGQS